MIKNKKHLIFLLITIILILLFYWLNTSGLREVLGNVSSLKAQIEALGLLGPIVVIVTLMIAIVISPLPSAPIALASGAIYGHIWGTIYVLIGSTLGAVIAFLLARLLGYDILKRWLGGKLAQSWVGSQNTLMGIVFFSRLMPFISFDIVSYAAGLTALTFGRFVIATVAGITPASFILAHFGGELGSADGQRVALAILAIGLLMGVPLIIKAFRK